MFPTSFCSLYQVTTPLIFKLIPVVMHLGILMHWFPSENSMQNEVYALLPSLPVVAAGIQTSA
jgi:hypothetical protein